MNSESRLKLMAAGPDVPALAADLARAVELTMSTGASQLDRMKAYNACETFKETSPLCAEAGLYLAASVQHSTISRHFGLQLMEHTVKYRWTQITQQEKIFIKENAMKLLSAGGISEEPHMKDALSRVIVEMVKREWPQQWPSLLAELSEACACGELQTELVLLVFLRLVEDVALLQTLESNQRRKDIYHALTANMAEIFDFFLKLIELHVGRFRHCNEASTKAMSHGRVVQVALLTLTGFVEWVSMTHIVAQNGRLLQILCVLLDDSAFQTSSAECLSQIVNRKGKLDERKSLMFLFNDEPIQCLVTAAKTPSTHIDEQTNLFKKTLIQILSGLSTQLCHLWGKDGGIQRPQNFSLYLEAILAFSSHRNLILAHQANHIWNSLLKHQEICRDPVFLSYLPQWVQCTAPKIVKFNCNPSPRSSPHNSHDHNPVVTNEVAYIRLDFDNEDEFGAFFYRCRSNFLDSFRQATVCAPLVTFNYVEQWLMKCLQVPNSTYGLTTTDPLYYEWEALATFLECILSRVLQAQERPSIPAGLNLLQLCLAYQPRDPLIMSSLLTCISALFVFLSMSTGQMAPVNSLAVSGAVLLPQVLDKIFSTLLTTEQGTTDQKAVKNLRRHAASLMVKIGNKYPLLLLPVFDQIRATVDTLSQTTSTAYLNTLEKVTLQESLFLISNHFGDYERQSNFIRTTLISVSGEWQRMLTAGAFKGAIEFINFIGLHMSGDEETPVGIIDRRKALIYCVNMLLGVTKRCSWPEDPERATRGGFVVGLTESGNPICRNPAAPHIVPLLPNLLALISIFNELYTVQAQTTIHDTYRMCFIMSDVEKSLLLGLSNAHSVNDLSDSRPNTTYERMQRFLTGLHESCYHMIGAVGPSLGRDLYSLPDLGLAIVNTVLAYLQHIPDYKVRPIIRVFLKPFVHSCPAPFYETVLLPIMAHFTPIMLSRLHTKWLLVNELRDRDTEDREEILEDILTRALTREYMDVMKVALVGGGLTPDPLPPTSSSSGTIMEIEDLNSMDSPSPPPSTARSTTMTAEVISDLGLMLLRNERTCQPIVLTVVGALSWLDSIASLKATTLTGPIVRQLSNDNSLNGEMAAHIMACVLRALTLHGQHEANQGMLLALGAQLYEILRPNFLEVFTVMQQIPGINPVDLQKLDERISCSTSKGNKVEKVKKDLFKKITGNLIGRSVGQLFKKEVKIHELPSFQIPKKQRSDKSDNNVLEDLRNVLS